MRRRKIKVAEGPRDGRQQVDQDRPKQMAATISEKFNEFGKVFSEKRQAERMLPFFRRVAELTQLEQPLGIGRSFEDDVATFSRLLAHAENLWSDAGLLFSSQRFAPSLFLSIVTLEEIGKIAIVYLQVFARDQARMTGQSAPPKRPDRKKNPLYSHTQKHLLASCAGAVVNSRLDRILGMERVNRFIATVEGGKLEKLRQGCLYYEMKTSGPHCPYEVITEVDAGFYLVVSGELLAEVGLLGTSRYIEFLSRVEEFEKHLGFVGK